MSWKTEIDRDALVEALLEQDYDLIDVLPKQVSADAAAEYFAVEEVLSSGPHHADLTDRFVRVLLKLMCYWPVEVWHEEWLGAPGPTEVEALVRDLMGRRAGTMNVLVNGALVLLNGDDLYMTVYGASEELRETLSALAASEGLFYRHN